MTTADAIYELVSQLPEEQAQLVWTFAQFVQKQSIEPELLSAQENIPYRVIPPGTLTGLLGIAKSPNGDLSDEDVLNDYTDYLIQKYQ